MNFELQLWIMNTRTVELTQTTSLRPLLFICCGPIYSRQRTSSSHTSSHSCSPLRWWLQSHKPYWGRSVASDGFLFSCVYWIRTYERSKQNCIHHITSISQAIYPTINIASIKFMIMKRQLSDGVNKFLFSYKYKFNSWIHCLCFLLHTWTLAYTL